jgi:site-specific recombinase XerD
MPSTRSLIESFIDERRLTVAAPTARGDRAYIAQFVAFIEGCGVDEVAAVTEEHLAEYALDLRGRLGRRHGRPLSDSYISRSLGLARMFLVWARAQGYVLLDFSSFPVTRPLQKLYTIPSIAQVNRLLDAPDTDTPEGLRDALIIEFFYTLGVRSRECIRLDVGHVDLGAGTVRVASKGRERLLPMSPRLTALVTRYLRDGRPNLRPHHDEPALWIAAQTGRRLHYTTIKQRLARFGDLQGLKVHPHLLRHACATHLLEAGAEPEAIQQLLGHKRASSTERYAQVQPAELAAEHSRSHPRAR